MLQQGLTQCWAAWTVTSGFAPEGQQHQIDDPELRRVGGGDIQCRPPLAGALEASFHKNTRHRLPGCHGVRHCAPNTTGVATHARAPPDPFADHGGRMTGTAGEHSPQD